jgi:hypothetical protein
VAAPLEVDRPHQIDHVQLVGGPGLRSGVLLAGQQRGQTDPRRGQPVAPQDALDVPFAGERAGAQGLQLSADGRGSGQAVAGGRRGMGLEPAADREDGPLQFGRDALGDVVVGPGQVVEAVGAGLQIAAPPLVELAPVPQPSGARHAPRSTVNLQTGRIAPKAPRSPIISAARASTWSIRTSCFVYLSERRPFDTI